MPPTTLYRDREQIGAIEKAIISRFDEIIALASLGSAPVMALVPDLEDLICEAAYWRLADRSIGYALAAQFERAGRTPVSISLLPRAAVYKRNAEN